MGRRGHGLPTYNTSSYNPAIDGLRALAVSLVVTYHVGIPFVGGGYIGVDVFFVISGFLIINQIVGSMAQGKFSFAEFWARRAIRILPPYLLVIAVSAAIGMYVLVLPGEFSNFGKEVLYSSLMVVNHYYLGLQGYFDTSVDTKPLLHLWSLSVEEQFYVVAPLAIALLWLIRRSFGASAFAVAVAAIFVMSLVACIYLTGGAEDTNYAFYLMPLRAWEFMLGGMIAVAIPRFASTKGSTRDAVGFTGLALVVAAGVLFSHDVLFPSWNALVPVVGSALVILAVSNPNPSTFARCMSLKPVVWTGLVSYSWYLWHWPLLTLGRIYNFGERILWFDAMAGLLSLVLAAATFYLLERPLRDWRRSSAIALNWRPVMAGIAACIPVAVFGYWISTSLATSVEAATPARLTPAYQMPDLKCHLDRPRDISRCISASQGRPIGLIMGDSHARAAFSAFEKAVAADGGHLAALAMGGCPPFFNTIKSTKGTQRNNYCIKAQKLALAAMDDGGLDVEFAILLAQWGFHNNDLTDLNGNRPANRAAFFIDRMRETMQMLRDRGVKRILVVGNVPLMPKSAPECVSRALKYGYEPAERCGATRERTERRNRTSKRRISAAIEGMKDVRYFDPTDLYCDDRWCSPFDGESVIYSDHSHLTELGISRITERYAAEIRWVVGAKR